jgi:alpha-L-fucosidase
MLKEKKLSTREDIINHSSADDLDVSSYPEWLRERLEWFQDQKLGFMVHWGLYSHWSCSESWALVPEDTWARSDSLKAWTERGKDMERFQKDYWALIRDFNPTAFDPERWAKAAADAGARYASFTTKHHDGFCLWDTRTTDLRVTHPDCPFHNDPRANVVKILHDAFRAHGMGISCYFSKSDWYSPWYWDPERPFVDRNPNYDTHAEPERWEKFVAFVHAQVEELVRDCGPIDCLWLDGGQVRPPDQDIRMDDMVAMARRLQPGLLVADRTVGGRHENILTPEQKVPDAPLGHPWESCITMSSTWGYSPTATYKSAREIVGMLIEVVSKGGNLMLNVGPKPDGTLEPVAYERLETLGDWMKVHGEGIYGTRAVEPYGEGPARFTRKGNVVYAFVNGDLTDARPPEDVCLTALRPRPGAPVWLLGRDEPLAVEQTPDGVHICLPQEHAGSELPWCVKYETELSA